MRRASPLLALAVLHGLSACGDASDDGPTACELGPSFLRQALDELRDGQPLCSRDEECVLVKLDVSCAGYESIGCGEILHRDTAARWSADAVCQDIEMASRPSELACSTQASCASPGRPRCGAGRCTGDEGRQ